MIIWNIIFSILIIHIEGLAYDDKNTTFSNLKKEKNLELFPIFDMLCVYSMSICLILIHQICVQNIMSYKLTIRYGKIKITLSLPP